MFHISIWGAWSFVWGRKPTTDSMAMGLCRTKNVSSQARTSCAKVQSLEVVKCVWNSNPDVEPSRIRLSYNSLKLVSDSEHFVCCGSQGTCLSSARGLHYQSHLLPFALIHKRFGWECFWCAIENMPSASTSTLQKIQNRQVKLWPNVLSRYPCDAQREQYSSQGNRVKFTHPIQCNVQSTFLVRSVRTSARQQRPYFALTVFPSYWLASCCNLSSETRFLISINMENLVFGPTVFTAWETYIKFTSLLLWPRITPPDNFLRLWCNNFIWDQSVNIHSMVEELNVKLGLVCVRSCGRPEVKLPLDQRIACTDYFEKMCCG